MRRFLISAAVLGLVGCGRPLAPSSVLDANTLMQRWGAGESIPLAESRAALGFREMSAVEKKTIAAGALAFVSELYVNLLDKRERFGVDAVAEVNAVAASAEGMNSGQFHAAMQKAFHQVRDGHLQYGAPWPNRCFKARLPVSFRKALGADGKELMVISGVDSEKLSAEQRLALSVGNAVIRYNGQDSEQVFLAERAASQRPNPSSEVFHATRALFERRAAAEPLPDVDSVALEVLAQGSPVTVVLPWLVEANVNCLKWPPQGMEPVVRSTEGNLGEEMSWKVVDSAKGKLGVLRLSAFSDPMDQAVQLEAALSALQTETKALVIDLRGNGGGDFYFSLKLPAYFTAGEYSPVLLRSRATQGMRAYAEAYSKTDAVRALDAALANRQAFTAPYPVDPEYLRRSGSGLYTRPIAILVDGGCFSACESFTATMADNGLAVVVGDFASTTGGGGAVIEDFDWVHCLMPERPGFDAVLPYGISMGAASEQHVRVGAHAGQLIESVGVEVARTISTRQVDIASGQDFHVDGVADLLL